MAEATGSKLIIDVPAFKSAEHFNKHQVACIASNRPAEGQLWTCNGCYRESAKKAEQAGNYELFACEGITGFVVPIIYDTQPIGYVLGRPGHHRDGAQELSTRRLALFVQDFVREIGRLIQKSRSEQSAVASFAETLRSSPRSEIASGIDREAEWALKRRAVPKAILQELSQRISFDRSSLQLIEDNRRTLLAGQGFDDEEIDRSLLVPPSDDPLIRRVVESLKPIILSDTSADHNWEAQKATAATRSWIGAPVIYDRAVIGLLTLDHNEVGKYSDAHGKLVEDFLAEKAHSIWLSRFWDSTARLIRNMEVVNEITQVISDELEICPMLKSIARQITERLHCSHCTIFLSNDEGFQPVLKPEVTHGAHERTLERSFREGEGFAGWVFSTGRPICSGNAGADHRFASAREAQELPRSMVVVPITVGDQTLGVISADQDAANWFSEGDEWLLLAVARQAGIGIQRSKALDLLQKLGNRIIQMTEVRPILQELVEGAITLTNTTGGVIYLLTEEGTRVADRFAPIGFQHPPPRLEQDEGLTRTIVRHREVVPITDLHSDERVNPVLRETFTSMIGIPLVTDQVIGVLYLTDRDRHVFKPTEISLLKTLATQAAIAIQNATYLDRLRQQVKIHSVIQRLLDEVSVYESDQEKAFESIACKIQELIGPDVSVAIHLYTEETNSLGASYAYGPLRTHLCIPPRENGTGRHVLKTRTSLFVEDISRPPTGCPTIRQETVDLGVRSFVALPLRRQNLVVGILFVHSQHVVIFTEELQRALSICAGQAGIAIQISILHEAGDYRALIKAADLGFLASGIAHEFRNNLQNILSCQYILRTSGSDEQYRSGLGALKEECEKAARTIDMFASFRRSSEREIDVSQITRQLIQGSRRKATDLNIDLRCGRMDSEAITANPDQVQSIVINLLRNAMEAVELSQDRKRIKVEVLAREGNVEIAIADSGVGIPESLVEQVFLPYFSTKQGSKNMGVGLFWVNRIVRRMGGTIKVDGKNEMGGATFRVIVPAKVGAGVQND